MPTPDQFVRDNRRAVINVQDEVSRDVRRLGVALLSTLQNTTPVDEHTAKANWLAEFNQKTDVYDENLVGYDAESLAFERARNRIQEFNMRNPSLREIHIFNNIPYIVELDDDWSTQTGGQGILVISVAQVEAAFTLGGGS